MNNPGGIAGLGRGEDTMLAHVAPGEMVVPPVITPETQKIIEQENENSIIRIWQNGKNHRQLN